MIAWIKQLIAGSGSRKLSLVATADHVELTATHLVLGLKLDWRNQTNASIPIKEVQVMVYLHGQNKEPLRFYPALLKVESALEKKSAKIFLLEKEQP